MKYFYDDGGPLRERHLVCIPYSVENLHLMANDLGIGKHWFHGGTKPHYDVPVKMMKTIHLRATKVSTRRILAIIQGKIQQ